jgi:uncharacterized membrane protein
MEDFVLILLVIAVVWLAFRQRSLRRELGELRDLYLRLTRTGAPQPAPPPLRPAPPEASHAAAAVAPPPAPAAQHAPPVTTAPYSTAFIPPPPPAPTPHPYAAPPPPRPPVDPPPPRPRVSLEERLGQNWLNKLGIVILVIGVALFLGVEARTLGPLGKSLIGFALAAAILGGGLWLERKPTYRLFARACIGGGWALLFFLSFAIYHLDALRIVTSQMLDLTLMLAVAGGMVVHSLRYRSQVVTSIAFLLAFLTVGISDVTLFSLVAGALLAAALACVVARERWFALGLAGLVGVYVNHFLWLHRVLPDGGVPGHPFPQFIPSAALLLAYWLTFRLVYIFRPPSDNTQQLLTTFTAILNTVGLLGLLKYQSAHPEWAFWGLLTLGVAELALSLLAKPRNRIAFIVLSTISSVLLLAAVPFRYSGANWPLLWLLEAEAFFIAGVRLRESVFRRLGILAGFATAAYLLFGGILAAVGLAGSSHVTILDAGIRVHLAIALFAAALVFWLNAEFFTRRFPSLFATGFDRIALRVTSYVAAVLASLGLGLAMPTPALGLHWLGVVRLLLALALAEVADRVARREGNEKPSDLSTQSDLLALHALLFVLVDGLRLATVWHGIPLRALTVGLSAVLLYLAMRRKTAAWILPARFIGAAYSWAAAGLVALLLWYQLEPVSVAVAWGVFGLILFELGLTFRKGYLRYQAYALLAAAFVRLFFANLNLPAPDHGLSPSLYTVIPLVAALSWVYERSRSAGTRFDEVCGRISDCCGLTALFALLYFEVRADWVVLAWTLATILVLALAALMKRRLFVAQSLVLLLAVAARALAYHLFSTPPLDATFFTGNWFTVGATCALLLLSLPLAFAIRKSFTLRFVLPEGSLRHPRGEVLAGILSRPEQPWFFVPLALLTVLLFVQLHGALITIGWVALGVATFLFALTVSQRSYRLSGLGLLLLGVAKVLVWDVWHAQPTERYLTLILLGAALLLVSFLYSRYRETLLKFL